MGTQWLTVTVGITGVVPGIGSNRFPPSMASSPGRRNGQPPRMTSGPPGRDHLPVGRGDGSTRASSAQPGTPTLSEGLFLYHSLCYNLPSKRSRRLTVRTPGFHPGNRGSIPRGITITEFSASSACFIVGLPL